MATLQNIGGFQESATRFNFKKGAPNYIADSLVPGDFNGDGKIDLAIFRLDWISNPSAPVQILTGDGKGGFVDSTVAIFPAGIPNTNFVARALAADINGDGVTDLFCIDTGADVSPWTGGQNKLFLSNGKGQLINSTSNLPQVITQNHGASLGDVNNDGLLDVLVNSLNAEGSQLMLQGSNGQFTLSQQLLPNLQVPYSYGDWKVNQTNTWSGLIDINADGRLDMILGAGNTSPNLTNYYLTGQGYYKGPILSWPNNPNLTQLYINKGQDVFANSVPITLPNAALKGQMVMQVMPLDINGDNLPDLALSVTEDYTKPYIQLLINKGDGNFVDETSTRIVQQTVTSGNAWYKYLNIIDFNHDGYSDIAAIADGGTGVTVFLNDKNGHYSQVYTSVANYGYGAIADVNNDGMSDIIASTTDASSLVVWTNQLSNGHIYKANFGGDTLLGSSGNDLFYGRDGQDSFNGNGGMDIAVYAGQKNNFTISQSAKVWVITDKSFTKNSDNLTAISRLQFTDTNIALDIGKDQTAGSGYMLYKAAFNRTPDASGLGYWISKMDSGMSYSDVAKNFVTSTEFKTAFGGSSPSVNTLVTKLYNNVLNRTPDAGGLAFWQDKLNTGWSTPDVLGFFSTSGENVTNVTPLIANGISYTQFVG
jgi:Domain of unknown function (DUF4214)/FG-GAP-like repeat